MGDAGEALNLLAHLMALLVVPHLDHGLHNDIKLGNLNSGAVVPHLDQAYTMTENWII